MKKLLLVFLFLLSSCDSFHNDSIIGRWRAESEQDGVMIFHANGVFEVLDSSVKLVFDNNSVPTMTWEAITEVEPHQIYITMSGKGKKVKIPFGIFKIEKNKLIFRQLIEYHQTLGGFNMGVSRYEMPKDFSGDIKVFNREK